MKELPQPVETAVDYAARDVARAIVAAGGSDKDYATVLRTVGGMLRGVAAGALKTSASRSWTATSGNCWWLERQADTGPGGLDKNALATAVRAWWEALDEAGKYKAIIGKKPERGDQFVNEKIQHFENKTEQDLAAADPKLLEEYRKVKPAGDAAPAAPAPAAPAAPKQEKKPAAPAPEAPAAPETPAEPAEKPEQRSIFDSVQAPQRK